MLYHAQAVLPGGRTKSIINKDYNDILTNYVLSYVLGGTIRASWGGSAKSYQVLELRIYQTEQAWDKREGITFESFTKGRRNIFSNFEKKAKEILNKEQKRVFIVMPIQGREFGSQDEQRIYKEYDDRFFLLEELLQDFECTAIRIDKEFPIEQLVKRIKDEITKSQFIIADLTDERPSCYFESGYAEALGIPIIYIASESSVVNPKEKTKIHFDIHMNILMFSNHKELSKKVKSSIEKN
ncbi:hypothetical protein EHQ61_00695 [Leptospira wolffii]|uniref:hypothetical protein n=1 Tax=Leptospira wolffii TaxID=409998 RepID=UPI0010834CF4|nr:hypothetical protein [Leptospira wolffii]TGL55263.1 hypothetical protein EHQ61_00695 [Leptospira wolffii]